MEEATKVAQIQILMAMDMEDEFPDQFSQYIDSGDGYGDNKTLGAYLPDHWPFDPTRNIADVELSCSPTTIEVDLPSGDYSPLPVLLRGHDRTFCCYN